jgi:CxxC motif-containing protein
MPATEKMICITCPVGCNLTVTHEGATLLNVNGNTCERGLKFAEAELTDPRRMVATTVQVRGGIHPLVPVYTEEPFPKPRIFELLREIRRLEMEAPVTKNQVVLENALGEGIDVITSRDMPEAGA